MIPVQATHTSGVVISKIDGVDKMLLLKRVKGGYWCHVAGGVEAGETGWQTILRCQASCQGFAKVCHGEPVDGISCSTVA